MSAGTLVPPLSSASKAQTILTYSKPKLVSWKRQDYPTSDHLGSADKPSNFLLFSLETKQLIPQCCSDHCGHRHWVHPPDKHQLASDLHNFMSLYVIKHLDAPFCGPHLLSHRAVRNQMHGLLVLQIPSTWVCPLPHQQADCIQLCHPVLQAGSNMEGSVPIVGLRIETKQHPSGRETFMKAAHKPEKGVEKVIPALVQLLKLPESTFAFTKDRQLGSSRKRRMSSRLASSAAKCRAVRPLLRSLRKARGKKRASDTTSWRYFSPGLPKASLSLETLRVLPSPKAILNPKRDGISQSYQFASVPLITVCPRTRGGHKLQADRWHCVITYCAITQSTTYHAFACVCRHGGHPADLSLALALTSSIRQ